MPTLVIDKIEKVSAKFVSKSDLIWDSILAENERIIDKSMYFRVDSNFSLNGNNVYKISNFRWHKTATDCVV